MAASVPSGIFWSLRASMDASGSSLRSILTARRSPQVCLPANALGGCSYHPPQIVWTSRCAAASISMRTRARLWNSARHGVDTRPLYDTEHQSRHAGDHVTQYRTHTVGQDHRMMANDVCKPDGIF